MDAKIRKMVSSFPIFTQNVEKRRLIVKQQIKDVTAKIQNCRPHVYLHIKSDKCFNFKQKVKLIDNMFIFTLKA